jgi:hypothetical protein
VLDLHRRVDGAAGPYPHARAAVAGLAKPYLLPRVAGPLDTEGPAFVLALGAVGKIVQPIRLAFFLGCPGFFELAEEVVEVCIGGRGAVPFQHVEILVPLAGYEVRRNKAIGW